MWICIGFLHETQTRRVLTIPKPSFEVRSRLLMPHASSHVFGGCTEWLYGSRHVSQRIHAFCPGCTERRPRRRNRTLGGECSAYAARVRAAEKKRSRRVQNKQTFYLASEDSVLFPLLGSLLGRMERWLYGSVTPQNPK